MTKAFKISPDLSQNIDDFPNVHKINKEDYPDLSRILASEDYEYNGGNVVARCNLNQVLKFDFIANDLNIPIVSSRFINLLELEGLDEIDIIPLILIDDTYLGEVYEGERLKTDLPFHYGYFTIKFKKQYDFCNTLLSEYRKLRSQPESKGILRKPVFNLPEVGFFPPIFRIKDSVSSLFVSVNSYSIIKTHDLKAFILDEVEVVRE